MAIGAKGAKGAKNVKIDEALQKKLQQPPPVEIAAAAIENGGKSVVVDFTDGHKCRFHTLWLKDACRDEEHVGAGHGERYLTATPVGPSGVRFGDISTSAAAVEGGDLRLTWGDASFCAHEMAADPPKAGTFPAGFLRNYADLVAEPLTATPAPVLQDDMAWLRPFSAFMDAPASADDDMAMWRSAGAQLPVYDHGEVLRNDSEANLRMLQDLVKHGAVIIDGCEDPGEEALHRFADTCVGGLQKDPTRDEANWKIVGKSGATSVSYDHLKRLNNHTDSSIPPHGLPALCLLMHYADGHGTNTLTDGFAAAAALKEEDPEGYKLLATYGYDGERDFVASRVDSVQEFNRGLVVSTQFPVLQLDDNGRLKRIQYNEVFRMPSTLPYDVFPKWYAAFARLVELLHSEEFEMKVPMQRGRFLLMQNWRVLHGRAGGSASSNRTVVGGTVTREAFYSQARRLAREARGFTDVAQEEELVLRQ